VQKDIDEGRVIPGQYFILKFDFSVVNRNPNLEQADRSLKGIMTDCIENFYATYSRYLGDASKLSTNINPEDPAQSLQKCVNLIRNKLADSEDDPLADIRGVGYNLVLLESSVIANPEICLRRSMYWWMNMMLSAKTGLGSMKHPG